jgi:hypothetical protein
MKKGWMWCLLGMLSVGGVAWSQTGGTEKGLGGPEQQWLQAQKANNPDLVTPLLAHKIIVTGADREVMDKAGR